MRLAPEILFSRIDNMPQGPEHTTVWHLCRKSTHPGCYAVGTLAEVDLEVPELPSGDQQGWFLMRLHPPSDSVIANDKSGLVHIPLAVSYPHTTVWSVPEAPKQIIDPDTGEIL